MDLPDCPPGAEGYHDSVTEVPKKPDLEETSCTKAEQEFQEHLNSLKIKLEDGTTRCMVERRGRDISGKWIYLCYPCAAVCSGESILQTHISGKKHKTKLTIRTVWPLSIFENHPFNQNANKSATATEKVLQKMAEEVDLYNKNPSDLDLKYNKYRSAKCHIQDSLDNVKAPLVGVEYLIEHPPEQAHYEPSYICTLCSKQGHPRTIINHMTCFWHRCNYLLRHFSQACGVLAPYRAQPKYREGVGIILNRLSQRIEDKYGRMQPVNIEKEEYEKNKEQIHQWIFRGHHFSEKDGTTFTEVVDIGLIDSLHKSNEENKKASRSLDKREPSPPIVAAPSKPLFNNFSAQEDNQVSKFPAAEGAVKKKRCRTRPRSRRRGKNGTAPIFGPAAVTATAPVPEFAPETAIAPVPTIAPTSAPASTSLASALMPPPPAPHITSSSGSTVLTTYNVHTLDPSSFSQRPAGRQERRAGSVESLSDISDDGDNGSRREPARSDRDRHDPHKSRYEPYPDRRRANSPSRARFARNHPSATRKSQEKQRPPNYEYKVKLAEEKRQAAEESAKKTLAYHEKNPEKHPLYPEEWKKFWNKRYKEIQAEGKDPSKHDFKPEWILFWTARMKELHEEELRVIVNEIYRRMCLSPPIMDKRLSEPRNAGDATRASDSRRRSPDPRRHSPETRRRSPERRRPERSDRPERPDRPDRHDRPDFRAREPLPRRRSPPDARRDRRSPAHLRRSPVRRRSSERRRSPPHHKPARSRSPLHRRSPARTHITLESVRRSSRSPLSKREAQRNRSPEHSRHAAHSPNVAPSLQTVLISDDELKPDDGLSPWNSDNEIESVGSVVDVPRSRSRTGSVVSRSSKAKRPRTTSSGPAANMDGAADDVVATLRLLVALEDYLGSLGPKVVDLLAEALKMEKDKANSSEELLERESAVVLIETAKEKLKGAVQAGLVTGSAAAATRQAVVRAAATLHEADKRTKRKQAQKAATAPSKAAAVPVAGVGEVDRAQIAQQMAEALIAQGKTDVSSEELAQLVDAVVGMAEAKKREAEKTKKVLAAKPALTTPAPAKLVPAKLSGTASALQMLQSAYDENDKKTENTDVPDAMDGLSDSDLETLLKNFNELSAEEQHSLIAYLKKLEAKEPLRVERLRQYVSEAATSTKPDPVGDKPDDTEPVLVETDDDDDYTVEEVFQSATMKVKEDQIRQEMEIVKKSLEETKPEPVIEPTTLESSLADISKSLSSATDLFALVQASIKSTPAPTPAPLSRSPNVVVSNTQPRSFGDLPEAPLIAQEPLKPEPASGPYNNNQAQGPGSAPFQNQQSLLRLPIRHQLQQQQNRPQQQQQNYQSPQQNQQQPLYNQKQQQNYPPQNQQHNQPPQNQQNNQPPQNQQHNQPPQHQQNQPLLHQQQNQPIQHQQQYEPQQYHQQHNFNDNRNNQNDGFNQGHNFNDNRNNQNDNFNQGHNFNDNRNNQNDHFNQGHNFNDNRNNQNDNFNQGPWNQRPNNNMMDSRGPAIRGPGPDNFGSNAAYNQGPRNNFMNGRGQDTRPQNMNQQYGNNYDNQNNYRGRGGARGHYGGPRGRGRGYY